MAEYVLPVVTAGDEEGGGCQEEHGGAVARRAARKNRAGHEYRVARGHWAERMMKLTREEAD